MKNKIKQYIMISFGVVMIAFAVSVFYAPNKIVNGGVSGISTILFHALHIPPGLSFAAINMVLLLIAYKFIGYEFVVKTIFGAGELSVFVQLFTHIPPITNNIVLATVFGSIMYGIGIGIAFVAGASTGGTDILGRLIQLIFPYVEIGRLLSIVDAMVIGASLIIFKNIELTLWGILALFLSTFMIDWLIRRLNVSKLAFVVSNNGAMIADRLVTMSPRGVTVFDAVGAYTMNKNKVLMCAMKEKEIESFQKTVLDLDGDAFIIYSEAKSILGNGFRFFK